MLLLLRASGVRIVSNIWAKLMINDFLCLLYMEADDDLEVWSDLICPLRVPTAV